MALIGPRREPAGPEMAGLALAVINIALFQLAWFAAVYAAAHGRPLLAAMAPLGAAAVHLVLSRQRGVDLSVMLTSAVIGIGLETGLTALGFASYAAPGPVPAIAPPWLVALWFAFGTLPSTSLVWLKARPVLAAVLGSLGGSIAYYVAELLGAVTLAAPLWITYLVIAAMWAIAIPLIMSVAERAARTADGPAPPTAAR